MFIFHVWDQGKIEFGFEHRAAGSCPVAKRMTENFALIPNLKDFICQLKITEIQKLKFSNPISINSK